MLIRGFRARNSDAIPLEYNVGRLSETLPRGPESNCGYCEINKTGVKRRDL